MKAHELPKEQFDLVTKIYDIAEYLEQYKDYYDALIQIYVRGGTDYLEEIGYPEDTISIDDNGEVHHFDVKHEAVLKHIDYLHERAIAKRDEAELDNSQFELESCLSEMNDLIESSLGTVKNAIEKACADTKDCEEVATQMEVLSKIIKEKCKK